jgi:glycosyltransferase involved in cell wall biosynthesis
VWGNGAVERHARLEIRSFVDAGYDVRLLTQQPVDDRAADRWPELVALNPTVGVPGRFFSHRTSTKLLSFGVASHRFLRTLPAHATDLLIAHTPAAVAAAAWWCRRRHVRLVYVCHTSPRPSGKSLPTRHRLGMRAVSAAVERIAIRAADLVVCPAPSSRDFYARMRPDRPTISLENPVDTGKFRPDPSVKKDLDLLYVGRLSAEKGPAVLLRAAALIEEPLRIAVVGAGSERPVLDKIAAGCRASVVFAGVVPNHELPSWYQRARLVAVPSFTEAAGVVPVEAMASGTPVIASEVTGLIDSVVDGVNGWLVPPGEERAWTTKLHQLLADDEELRRAGKEATRTAQRFDSRRFANRVVDAYRTSTG